MRRHNEKTSHNKIKDALIHTSLFVLGLAICSTTAVAQSAAKPADGAKRQPTHRILVSIPDRKLALIEGGRVVKVYSVAVGAPASPSPSGEFHIVQRLENPAYYRPGVVIGPGASNPLGTRWMGLNVKGFGIHGTDQPGSVGKNASHGCVRLRNRDMEDLFARVRAGDRVSLLAQRDDEAARIFGSEHVLAAADETPATKTTPSESAPANARGGR